MGHQTGKMRRAELLIKAWAECCWFKERDGHWL